MTTPALGSTPGIAPTGPACAACGAPAAVHWQRRLTADEIATQRTIEQGRRDQVALLADPQLPAPVVPPMPDFLDATRIVPACGQHAIDIDSATLIHQATCNAPPTCDCIPETPPQPAPEPPTPELPPGW